MRDDKAIWLIAMSSRELGLLRPRVEETVCCPKTSAHERDGNPGARSPHAGDGRADDRSLHAPMRLGASRRQHAAPIRAGSCLASALPSRISWAGPWGCAPRPLCRAAPGVIPAFSPLDRKQATGITAPVEANDRTSCNSSAISSIQQTPIGRDVAPLNQPGIPKRADRGLDRSHRAAGSRLDLAILRTSPKTLRNRGVFRLAQRVNIPTDQVIAADGVYHDTGTQNEVNRPLTLLRFTNSYNGGLTTFATCKAPVTC